MRIRWRNPRKDPSKLGWFDYLLIVGIVLLVWYKIPTH